MRKVKAIVHSRQGPPIIQPYLDLAKLLVKEDLVERAGRRSRASRRRPRSPCVLAAAFFVPVRRRGARRAGAGDLFVFIYLVTLSSVVRHGGGAVAGEPVLPPRAAAGR